MAAPTYVANYATVWNLSTTPRTTSGFNGSLGDVLVAGVIDANDVGSENWGYTSSPAETWTEDAETTGGTNADGWIQTATAILTAARTGMTVTGTRTGGDNVLWGMLVAHFSGSDGLGAAARSTAGATGGPSLSITTTFENSAVVYYAVDWNAGDGTSRTHRTVNGSPGTELAYFRDSVNYTVYVGYIPDAGASGAKTVGLSAPTGQRYVMAAREVLGSSAAPALPPILVMPPRK